MSDRYKALFSLKPYGYSAGVPVLIYAGKLLWDNFSNRPCVQLKLQSLSPKVIQSVSVQIESKDYAGEIVESTVHAYNQLNVARDQFFGDQEVIPLNDTSGISFSASVVEVVLYDGTVLVPDEGIVKQLPDLLPLRTSLEDDAELEKQFQKENGKNHVYAPVVVDDIWRCSCGAINNEKEKVCHNCRIAFDADLHPELKGLKERRDIRVKAEAKTRARRAKQAKQLSITAAALAVAVCLIAAVVYFLIIPSSRYKQATKAYTAGDYQSAYELYTKNGTFKDSSAKAADSKEKYWSGEYNKVLTEGYETDSGDYGMVFSSEDVADKSTVFGLAYINDDDIPELLVSPYGEECFIFSITEGEGYLSGINMVNSWLSLNTDDNYEIGYYERNGFVYDRHSGVDDGYGYENEVWVPLNENEEFDRAIFSVHTEKYTYFGSTNEYPEYSITWSDDSEEYYDEEEFYQLLGQYVNLDTYKVFELYGNTDDNRHAQLNAKNKDA